MPRFLEGLPRPQNIGSVIVTENSSRVILRPGFFTFCGVLSRKLNRECVFVFGIKKNESSLAVRIFLFDSCKQRCDGPAWWGVPWGFCQQYFSAELSYEGECEKKEASGHRAVC